MMSDENDIFCDIFAVLPAEKHGRFRSVMKKYETREMTRDGFLLPMDLARSLGWREVHVYPHYDGTTFSMMFTMPKTGEQRSVMVRI